MTTAHDERDKARRLLREGVDPGAEKKRGANAGRLAVDHSFESVAGEWHERQKGRWFDHHQLIVIRSLESDVLLLALSKRLARDNPAKDLNTALLPKPKVRKKPAVTDLAALRDLLCKTETSGAYPVTPLASRLLALTGVRPGVVRGARWDEFPIADIFDPQKVQNPVWHIPAESMKLTQDRKDDEAFDHIVPLAPKAMEVLRAVHHLTGRGELLFPGQRHVHIRLSENAIGHLYNRVVVSRNDC